MKVDPAMRLMDLVQASPRLVEVLAQHGIVFCSGCYVTLGSSLLDVAHYNAVSDIPGFLRQLADALESPSSV